MFGILRKLFFCTSICNHQKPYCCWFRNPANHLGCIKPSKWWNIYHINGIFTKYQLVSRISEPSTAMMMLVSYRTGAKNLHFSRESKPKNRSMGPVYLHENHKFRPNGWPSKNMVVNYHTSYFIQIWYNVWSIYPCVSLSSIWVFPKIMVPPNHPILIGFFPIIFTIRFEVLLFLDLGSRYIYIYIIHTGALKIQLRHV